jgi:hypothetical protein
VICPDCGKWATLLAYDGRAPNRWVAAFLLGIVVGLDDRARCERHR